MNALESLIGELRGVCGSLPDRRKGSGNGVYAMADIGLSAFSLFFMGSPSFLAFQRALEDGHGRSNCQTLFGLSAIPTDAHIRQMLTGLQPPRSIRCSSGPSKPRASSPRSGAWAGAC